MRARGPAAARRHVRAWVALCLALASIAGTPPARAAGEDCGTGRDSPPSIYIPNGGTCSGSMQGESGPWGGASDSYHYDVTLDDKVAVAFSSPNCSMQVQPDGHTYSSFQPGVTYVSDRDGQQGLWIGLTGGPGLAPPDGLKDDDDCWMAPLTYNLNVTVYPNTRPAFTSIAGPAETLPGEPVTFVVSATDPDANLATIGVKPDTGTYTPFVEQEVASGTGTAWLSFEAKRQGMLTFRARDDFGAATTQTRTISFYQDDCGSGADVTTLARPFPFFCEMAHLWWGMSDTLDVYTFEVPAGTPRVYAGYSELNGAAAADVTLVSPSGTRTTAARAGVTAAGEAGPWTLEIRRGAGWIGEGSYALDVRALPAPAPPALDATITNPTHEGEFATVTFAATDPAVLGVSYVVDWDDPGYADVRYPASGTVPSGTGSSAQHEFFANSSPVVRVTATNTDGLSSTVSLPVVITPHDDCGTGQDAGDFAYQARPMGESCAGEIGYLLSQAYGAIRDGYDYFSFQRPLAAGPARATVTLELLTPGLSAQLAVGHDIGLAGAFVPASGSPQSLTLPAMVPGQRTYARIRWISGKGAYRLTVSQQPLP